MGTLFVLPTILGSKKKDFGDIAWACFGEIPSIFFTLSMVNS